MMPKKIVAIGPESTGKTVLCEELARHFRMKWCPEFAREYLLRHGKEYTYDDLLWIAKGQVEQEDDAVAATINAGLPLLFIDTDMYVMKVWSEFVFGKCHPYILRQIVERKYDLYLLCNTDLPWKQDELREYPDLVTRDKLFTMYKDLMVNQETEWMEIHGKDDERVSQAIGAINHFL
ncbi:MAG TPA: AAA family ATPase [Chitinophagaceae bacterium]|nr:AAA family ATPase [Chitinophagaceae bacterium]